MEPFQATQSKLGRKPTIPPALAEKLVEHLLLIERKDFGCTPDDVRRLVSSYLTRIKPPNHFQSPKKQQAKTLSNVLRNGTAISCRRVNQQSHPLPEPHDSTRNKWGYSLICTKTSLLLMITHLQLFST
jgi:hypothetical protein